MSLNSILDVARSALTVQQVIIQTAGHNIANAQTAGYSRQQVDLSAAPPQQWSYGSVGTGVVVTDVRRARDQLLDVSVRQETGNESAATQRQNLLGAVQGVLGEPSDTGLAAGMDAFWSSWSDLAAQPTSGAAKAVVVERGAAVASTLNSFDARLTDLRNQTTQSLDTSLANANTLAQQIAELNGRIVASEVGGQEASDLRDARDNAIDQLAAIGNVQALPRADGSVQVLFGNNTLVDGIQAKQLERVTDPLGKVALAFTDAPTHALQPAGGATQAMADFLNNDLQGVQDQLDAVANTLAGAVNQVVATGQNAAGQTPPPFFVNKADGTYTAGTNPFATPLAAGGITARTISVNPALVTDASPVPTSSSASRPADNDVALALAGLRTGTGSTLGGVTVTFTLPNRAAAATTTGTGAAAVTTPAMGAASAPTSFADFYNSAASALGAQVQSATAEAQVHSTLADQARSRRDSVSGVNVDEELTTLMQAQQAYAAAAKVVSTTSEMLQTLVQMI